jgi:DNA-binding beta-propeller fold protein YncE
VYIGGREARVIGVDGNVLYCVVPNKAYAGDVKIVINSDATTATATASDLFSYQKRMLVSTLCGTYNEEGKVSFIDGPFNNCGNIPNPTWLQFDPLNRKHLFNVQDGAYNSFLLNFDDSIATKPILRTWGSWSRLRTMCFTPDGEWMILSNDQDNANEKSTSILQRDHAATPANGSGFKNPTVLTKSKNCNGAAIHPINGEMYFNSYEKGQFYRFDLQSYLAGNTVTYEELFKIQDNQWEFNITIHPTGNYAYIIIINRHYIMRTDYNWTTKTFQQPYLVCGEPRSAGYVDGVGSKVRLSTPYQGVFVKNPDYAGMEDEYDFYFTEQGNHDIRILTPQSKVTTFAGRGSTNLNANANGYVDGEVRLEARFKQPSGLAYDPVENAFYVGDIGNHLIRKINLED